MAVAIAAIGVTASAALYANPATNLVLVPPTELPGSSRQGGDAMLLHETTDGRTLLYIEQGQGSRMSTLDVTDPVHIRGEGSVQLQSPGPFDFVSPVGKQAELIRFRQEQEEAVLDLHKESVPDIKHVPGLKLQGPVTRLGDDGFTVTGQASKVQSVRDYQVVETANPPDLSRVFDVKQVSEEVTNSRTGTTFLLTQNGLYLIRRPAVEWDKKRRDQEWFDEHNGD